MELFERVGKHAARFTNNVIAFSLRLLTALATAATTTCGCVLYPRRLEAGLAKSRQRRGYVHWINQQSKAQRNVRPNHNSTARIEGQLDGVPHPGTFLRGSVNENVERSR